MGPIKDHSINADWTKLYIFNWFMRYTYNSTNTGPLKQWTSDLNEKRSFLSYILYLVHPIFKTDNLFLSHFCFHWFLRRIFFNSGWLFGWFIAVYFFNILLTMICSKSDVRLLSVICENHSNTCITHPKSQNQTNFGTFYLNLNDDSDVASIWTKILF